ESFAGPRTAVFFPIVGTFFLFILVANWGSLMPGVGSIGLWRSGHEGVVFVPLLRGPTTDLNATLALAICSVVAAQVYSIRQHGLGGHLNRYLPLGRLMSAVRRRGPGQPSPAALLLGGVLDLFVGALEAFEELTKILSFSFRLFGNVFGGEVLLAVMAYLLPYLVSIPFLALEAFGGFIQAFIFAVLSTAFLARATAAHGGERQEPLANAEETAKI
ncbi:MAG: FoF1 ATP synthase subunit a, partial [Chloroflexota bacterium]